MSKRPSGGFGPTSFGKNTPEAFYKEVVLPKVHTWEGFLLRGGRLHGGDATDTILRGSHGHRVDDARNLHQTASNTVEMIRQLADALSGGGATKGELEQRLAVLERRMGRFENRVLWRLGSLDRRVRQVAAPHTEDDIAMLLGLLGRLHSLAKDGGLECLKEPEIEANSDATADIIWIDRRALRLLAFSVVPAAEVDEFGGRIWMRWADGDHTDNKFDPSDEEIRERLNWVAVK
jgi:hypothetical protein